jgi:hypothetical protein
MLRDLLAARLAQMGATPDYAQLAREVLGIRGASHDLARRLVEQALVVEDRRDSWRRAGQRACRDAPPSPGIYIFRDAADRVLYVGKAANLRRRLSAHFAERRWRAVHPAVARVAHVECRATGSELEALLREATLIRDLQPAANIQIGDPALDTRALSGPQVRDVVVVVPSVDAASAELVAASSQGDVMMQRTERRGPNLAEATARLWAFFNPGGSSPVDGAAVDVDTGLAPLVFSWVAGRGRDATRVDPRDVATEDELRSRLASLLDDASLFVERLVALR